MFDIIEVNETTDGQQVEDNVIETYQPDNDTAAVITTAQSSTDDYQDIYSTAAYRKEPLSELNFVTKSVKITKNSPKRFFKHKDIKKSFSLNETVVDIPKPIAQYAIHKKVDKNISDEVVLFPVMKDSSMRLNRTSRKKVPQLDNKAFKSEVKNMNSLPIDELRNQHQHVEVKWITGSRINLTETVMLITTKSSNYSLQNKSESEPLGENYRKVDLLYDITNQLEKKENVMIPSSESEKNPAAGGPVKFEGSRDYTSAEEFTTEPLEVEPEAQPRPNRQRQLTRPQRRTFYPYFFSRVLG